MATNVLAGMQYVQQQGELGRQQGLQQSFNRLAGQAYTAPAAQQNALVGQAVGIDPQAGIALGTQLASRNQAAETDHVQKISGAARYMAQALESKNPAQIEGAYQAVRPYLAELGQQVGKVPPEHWDPSMEPGVFQIIAQTGGAPDVKGVVVAPGSILANPATGASLLHNPASLQYQNVPMGEGKAAGAFDPATGTVRPAVPGAAQGQPQGQPQPQGDPMQGIVAQANQMIRDGVPQAQVEAWMQQQAQAAGLNPQPAGQDSRDGGQLPSTQPAAPAQFGIGTPKPAGDSSLIQKRTQEIADLARNGVHLTDTQRQNYLTTGKPGEDSGATPQDPLAGLSPSDAALVKSIATYRTLPSSLGRSSNRAELLARANMLNPDYNEAGAKGAYTYITDLSKNGPTSAGGTVQSINTGLNHLGTLMRANDELAGTNFPLFNKAANFAATETGSSAATNWKQATYLFSQEMAKLVKGGVANEGEVRDIVDQLSASKSPRQRDQAIQQAAEFMFGRIQAVEDRGDRVLGSLAPDVSLMTKEAQDNLRAAYKLGGRALPDLRPPGDAASYLKQVHGAAPPTPQAAPAAGGVDSLLNKYGVQ